MEESILNEVQQQEARRLVAYALELCVKAQREQKFDPLLLQSKGFVLEGAFKQAYGVFVTLKKQGQLRGCIGNIIPYSSLAESIWGRAQDAALGDPRFPEVQVSELGLLEFEISILSRPEEIKDSSEIVIGKHGVIFEKFGRSAVFLPQVAVEQNWGIEEMLGELCWKAGLDKNAWRENSRLQVFCAEVF